MNNSLITTDVRFPVGYSLVGLDALRGRGLGPQEAVVFYTDLGPRASSRHVNSHLRDVERLVDHVTRYLVDGPADFQQHGSATTGSMGRAPEVWSVKWGSSQLAQEAEPKVIAVTVTNPSMEFLSLGKMVGDLLDGLFNFGLRVATIPDEYKSYKARLQADRAESLARIRDITTERAAAEGYALEQRGKTVVLRGPGKPSAELASGVQLMSLSAEVEALVRKGVHFSRDIDDDTQRRVDQISDEAREMYQQLPRRAIES